ncbi:MAG: hypothetical protein KGM49_09325 [Sphingomonadales bacterium]|nr:hypothetical protein [Sphingomonadales bacterium]
MTMQFRDLAAQAVANGAISADEILALRQAGWADGRIDPEEAESLFIANEHVTTASPEWAALFVEALSEFVVNTVEPHGYVDQAMADELIARIDHDGRVDSLTELELLVKVLEIARSVPANLKDYALRQIEEAVLTGEGPTRTGTLDPKAITEAECDVLRRVIFAAGGDRPAAVSRAEAEMLFRLKDATLYEINAPGWERVFVQGVANYLLGFETPEPLSRERAAELEAFMSSEGHGIGSFLGRMMHSEVEDNAGAAFGSLLDISQPIAEDAEDKAEIDEAEELWLRDRIDADEELDDMEKALLAFIAEETGTEALRS